ncbi:MAG: TRAP transporter small permease subunit [Geminicoccaceae bacterium]|nr:TRAP transporter small permease subunit [Geminicoccaceae bacterium]
MSETLEKLDISDEMIAERRSGDPGDLPDDMTPWMRRTITVIDTISLWSGRVICFMLVPVIYVMIHEVVARKLFIAPTLWAYDLSRMISGAMFMGGAAYALMRGVHIRADFLYRAWSARTQALIDATLYVLLYFPGIAVFFWISLDYAWKAWERGELSMDTAWMAPVAPVRSAMPVGAALLLLQGVSELLKSIYAIRHDRWP